MSENDPIRLREDPAESAGLRAMLEAAGGEHADDAMLERVLAGVLAGGGGGSGGGGGAAAAKGTGILGIGAGAAVAVAVIGVVVVIGVGMGARGGGEGERVAVSEGAADAGEGDGGSEADGGGAGEGDGGGEGEIEPPQAEHHASHPRVEAPPPSDPRDDFALVRQATAALESDPAHALELANAHAARFPDSPLAEEREADAILALAALHRDASARAASFRARWPRSAHLRRIDAALAPP